jgi:hypothetical protein
MPGTARWAAQVLSPGGGLSEGLVRTRWILLGWASLPGVSGSQLTGEAHWSWWRVLLPFWVVLGHNILYVAIGFVWLSH